ncbi:hypothetical protein PVAND_004623 [Polypedilum vanderplanki]|uniref:Uncharacterized protein n=1 Tax=Polypedilum vanderplanki TaxID=319348 RepID=A0A9J6BZN1_POLVA|nr:hypothetical protein PVAND_004623 [Polypedilum vanderplanki]
MLNTILCLIGAYSAFFYFYENLKSPIKIIFRTLKSFILPLKERSFSEKYGEWAVITGSSDGIGKQYAKELAKKGMKIVLISNVEKDLIKVKEEIEQEHSVEVKYIFADFSKGKEVYEELKKELLSLDIGILINNVGIFHEYPNYFDLISEEMIWRLLYVNIAATTMMSRMIIPQMKSKKRGLIVNISSGSDNQPIPLMAIYSASKVFVKYFTLALQKELEKQNVQVQLVTPMYVRTNINRYSTSIFEKNSLIADAESFVKSAVFTLGKTSQTSGYWIHGLQIALMKLIPQSVRTIIGYRLSRMYRHEYHEQQQRKHLKK